MGGGERGPILMSSLRTHVITLHCRVRDVLRINEIGRGMSQTAEHPIDKWGL